MVNELLEEKRMMQELVRSLSPTSDTPSNLLIISVVICPVGISKVDTILLYILNIVNSLSNPIFTFRKSVQLFNFKYLIADFMYNDDDIILIIISSII